MNDLSNIDELLQQCGIDKQNVSKVTSGPFFKQDYVTYRFRVESPETSMVDIESYVLVVACKGKKLKFYPEIKEAPRGYLLELEKHLEQLARSNSLEHVLEQVYKGYDAVLLKFYVYFQRYESVDGSGCTCLRYYYKPESELPEELRAPAWQAVQKAAEQKDVEEEVSIEEEKSLSTAQVDDGILEVCAANETANDEIPDKNTVEGSQTPQQREQPTTLAVEIPKIERRERKSAFKLYDETEIKTIDQFYEEVQEIKRASERTENSVDNAEKQLSEDKEIVEAAETAQIHEKIKYPTRNILHKPHDNAWTPDNADAFCALVRGLGNFNLSENLMRLCRRFDGFCVSLADEDQLSFSIDVPLRAIRFQLCPNLPLFSSMFSSELYSLQFVFNINAHQPKKSILRVDPTGDILTKLIQHSRTVPAELAYSMDYCNFQFLSILSRELTGVLRLEIGDIPSGNKREIREISFGSENVQVFQPKTRRAVPKIGQNEDIFGGEMTQDKYDALIARLPEHYRCIPLYNEQFPLCRNIDLIFELFYDVSKYAAEILRQEHVQQVIEQELDSSAAEDADYTSDDDDDGYEDDYESSDSVYDTYASVTDEFLIPFDPEEQLPGGVRLHLSGLELDNAMILQFQKVMASVYCTKCTKMNIITLESEIPPLKQSYSDLLTGTETCKSCSIPLTLHLISRLFNSASVNISGIVEPLFVLKHVNCLPSSLAYFEQSCIVMQCDCGTLSLQNELRVFYGRNGQGCTGWCPVCFKKLSLEYQNQFFALANGEQIKVENPTAGSRAPKQLKTTPLTGDGTCKHYPRSYRFFRFACGQAFPCDVCHEENCDCGDELAKTMICGFCGKSQPVGGVCVKCRKNLTKQRGTHWEGGEGCRDRNKMNRKDDKKFRGIWKTRSKADRKRTAMQKRGNAKKKAEEEY